MEDQNIKQEESGVNIPINVRERVQLAIEQQSGGGKEKPQRGAMYSRAVRPAPANVSDSEKMWAAAAHGSALLTIALLLTTGGIGSILSVFIPFVIYLIYRNKSEYVAHHALQSFAAQGLTLIGSIGAIIVTWTAFIVLSIVLAITIVGLLAIVPLALVAVGITLAALMLPLALVIFSMIAAVDAWSGENYVYPWMGEWVEDQMYERRLF
jgi:uncharacterized Tic20 family protein